MDYPLWLTSIEGLTHLNVCCNYGRVPRYIKHYTKHIWSLFQSDVNSGHYLLVFFCNVDLEVGIIATIGPLDPLLQ